MLRLLSKLSLILFGFVVGLQAPAPPTVPAPVPAQTSTTRPFLRERELIELIADYDIKHIQATPNLPWYGLSDFDSRTIWMVQDADLALRRKVSIHEAWHVVLRLRGDDQFGNEDLVADLSDSEYKLLFGENK